jgi:hypothetical protein
MYKTAEAALDRILALVAKCPKELQEKCFEVLLSGYVQMEVGTVRHSNSPVPAPLGQPPLPPPPHQESSIPQGVLPRFKNTAKRVGVELEKLEALFDFNVDPFGLHAITVSGKNNADKTRSVALLAAARSYLATGAWSADWQEVKSLCVDQNCYDLANYSMNLKKGAGTLFKSVEPGKPIELSSAGIKEAEKLLKGLVEGTAQ